MALIEAAIKDRNSHSPATNLKEKCCAVCKEVRSESSFAWAGAHLFNAIESHVYTPSFIQLMITGRMEPLLINVL